MSENTLLSPLSTRLTLVFVSMLVIMSAYELAKQVYNPEITIWESHAVTIAFTSLIAVFIVYFPLRSLYREQQKSNEAFRHQLDAEESLRRSEARYRSFVESAGDAIYTVDPDLRYLLVNTRHLAKKGLLPGACAGKHYGEFHSREETEAFAGQVRRVIETNIPVQGEYERDGRHYLRKLSPVNDSATDAVVAITVISTDITEQKIQERALETTNRKLNLMSEITRHDMLNQLTVLNSYLALAEEHTGDPTVTRYLIKCGQQAETIQTQIFFARDYQQIGVERPQWQDIGLTIRRAGLPLRLTSVTIDDSCTGLEVFCDPLLERVFYNLLDNAVRYAGPAPEVRFSAADHEDHLTLVYEDKGPGIPAGNKEVIFVRGYGKNTGLGLFLIREILGITGITIRETGEEGTGCRFEICVPAGGYRHRPAKEDLP
jgi:PAS domain S-box-containing protein